MSAPCGYSKLMDIDRIAFPKCTKFSYAYPQMWSKSDEGAFERYWTTETETRTVVRTEEPCGDFLYVFISLQAIKANSVIVIWNTGRSWLVLSDKCKLSISLKQGHIAPLWTRNQSLIKHGSSLLSTVPFFFFLDIYMLILCGYPKLLLMRLVGQMLKITRRGVPIPL